MTRVLFLADEGGPEGHSERLLGVLRQETDVTVQHVPRDAAEFSPARHDVDLIFNRSFPRGKEFFESLGAYAVREGVPVTNPAGAIVRSMDKRTYPDAYPEYTPRTATADSIDEAVRISARWGFPLVAKHPLGFGGKEVIRIDGPKDLYGLEEMLRVSDSVVIQEFLPGLTSGDIRMMFTRTGTGVAYLGALRRVPAREEWRSNATLGGSVLGYRPARAELRMSHDIARRSGLDYVAVDIGHSGGRVYLIETNETPGGPIENFCPSAASLYLSQVKRIAKTSTLSLLA